MSAVRTLWSKAPGTASKLFAFEKDGKTGFIDPAGRIVIPPEIDARIEDVGDFSEGLARVNRQGYISDHGQWVTKRKFSWQGDYSEGITQATVEAGSGSELHDVLLDREGNILTRLPVLKLNGAFHEGLAVFDGEARKGVRRFQPGNIFYRDFPAPKGFIDRSGGVVIPTIFADAGPFQGGLARVVLDGYCHIAGLGGNRRGSPTSGYPSSCGGAFEDAISPCKVGFINSKGQFAIEAQFESALDFSEDLAAVRTDNLWGFIDRQGAIVIKPRYEAAQSFQEGLAAVKSDGKWGFIDKTGAFKIEPQFLHVESFSDSTALIIGPHGPFYIDRQGRMILAGPFREATPFVHGLAAVLRSDTRVAYINKSGRTVFQHNRSAK